MPSTRALYWGGTAGCAVVAATIGTLLWRNAQLPASDAEPTPVAAVAQKPNPPSPIDAAAPSASAPQSAPEATPSASLPQKNPEATPAAAAPAFDLARVEPSGEAVVAGRAAPGAKVELRDGKVKIADATADAAGNFVMIAPAPLGPGDHSLQLAVPGPGAPVLSAPVSVNVPAQAAKAQVPPLALAPKPTVVAALPKIAANPVAKPAAATAVEIKSIDAPGGGRLDVKGVAAPGAVVRLYLNGSFLADATADGGGGWSLTIQHGMTAGAYALRADVVNAATGAVLARAEAPVVYPEAPAPPKIAAAPAPAPAKAETAPASEAAAAPSAPPKAAPALATPAPTLVAAAPAAAPKLEPAQTKAAVAASPPSLPALRDVAAAPAPSPKLEPAPAKATVQATPAALPAPQDVAAVAAPAPSVAPAPALSPASAPANVVIEAIRTATVVRGDSLWRLSSEFYGEGYRYPQIFAANANQIRDPNLIYPGQIFVVPATQTP